MRLLRLNRRMTGLSQFGEGSLLAGKRPLAGRDASNLRLFSHVKNIVDLDAQIANCAFLPEAGGQGLNRDRKF